MAGKGRPKTGGRKKGTRNKATAEVRELAQQFGPAAVERLAHIALSSENEKTAVAACKELLDRAYGRAPATMEHTGAEGGPIEVTNVGQREVMRRVAYLLRTGEYPQEDRTH